MPRHSKNRTSAPVVSSNERTSWNYGSKKARLGAESFLNFDSCVLCLQRARSPIKLCDAGHVYCNECVVQNLVSQKKDIRRHQATIASLKAEEETERRLARENARLRVLSDFETSQSSVISRAASSSTIASSEKPISDRGVKRKFEMQQDEIDRLVSAAEERALKQLEAEQAENRKAKLPAFWLPSLTPSAGPSKLMEEPKLSTLCHASNPPHPMSLKSLTTIHFAVASSKVEDKDPPKAKDDEPFLCWSCRDQFGKSKKMVALKPCGHVLCQTCFTSLSKEAKVCAACDQKMESTNGKGKDHIELAKQGTGYSAGGQAEVKSFDLAFQ